MSVTPLGRAALAGLVSLAVYGLLLQSQPYGDGITYLVWLRDRNFIAHHLLYLPDLWLGTRPMVLLGMSERTAAFAFSALCGAAGNAVLCWLLATSRVLAPDCRSPLLLTALAALAPSTLFFATQVENHAHHYFWITVLLLALDRALAGAALGRWLLAGLALLGAYASHTSCVLLLPALLVAAHALRHGRLVARPSRRDLAALGLLLLPCVAFRAGQGFLLVQVLGADPAWGSDTSLAFMRSLLAPRDLATWADYLWHELLAPAAGLAWAFVIAAFARGWPGRRTVAIGLLALLPYVLVFGHWNVRELGAYYLPLVPVFAVLVARLRPRPRREEAIALLVLALLQGTWGGWRAATWVEGRRDPPWELAATAARLAGPDGTVLFWSGLPALHLSYDHRVEGVPLENWALSLRGPASQDPTFYSRLADEVLPGYVATWHAKGGPLLITRVCLDRLAADGGLRLLRAKLESLHQPTPTADPRFVELKR